MNGTFNTLTVSAQVFFRDEPKSGADAYRYGFGGQEKDDEIYGEGKSYTAEFWQYDSRLGRRWNGDPMAWKFPWMSTYATFANNPIRFVDPDGRIGILFDEEGNKVATYNKKGITVEKGMENSSALKNFNAAVDYVDGKTDTYKNIFNSKSVVNIHVSSNEEASASVEAGTPLIMNNGKLGAQTVDVSWNPKMGLETSDGAVSSPAMVLFHEMVHAESYITDYRQVESNMNIEVPGYTHKEEYNTIQTVNQVAKSIPWEASNRSDHYGQLRPVIGKVTSTLLAKPIPSPIIAPVDNTRVVSPFRF